MIQSRFEQYARCYGGGGGGGKVKPPAPPAPTTAAENLAKSKILDRQRNARGYGATLIGSLAQRQEGGASTFLKKLLGE